MKLQVLLSGLSLAALGNSAVIDNSINRYDPLGHPFLAPGPGDRKSCRPMCLSRRDLFFLAWCAKIPLGRSPCPMLNSLANHGWLARSGLNISVTDIVNALEAALNMEPDSSRPIVMLAATTSTRVILAP